jgi:hypothetical protein
MDNIFSWVDDILEDVILGVNDTPLSEFLMNRDNHSVDITAQITTDDDEVNSQESDHREWLSVRNSIIQNVNRVRVLSDLARQTVSDQNLDYNYNINIIRNSLHNPHSQTYFSDFFNNIVSESLLRAITNPESFEDVKVTISEDMFDELEDIIYDDALNIDEPCNICMETYTPGQYLKKLDCGHFFHKDCVKQWLCNEKTTCPICRKDVRETLLTAS